MPTTSCIYNRVGVCECEGVVKIVGVESFKKCGLMEDVCYMRFLFVCVCMSQ